MKTLLIAEDERREVNFLTTFMGKYFLNEIEIVAVCRDGQEACERAAVLKPDMVFLDIEMPVINGIDAARKIKEDNPDCEILLLSAHSLFQYAKQAIKIGVYDYLVKPYLNEELREAVEKLLDKLKHQDSRSAASDEALPASGDLNSIVRLTVEYIEKYYYQDISLNAIAREIGVSFGHLGKCFKQDMGVSFNDYLAQYRIEKAKLLFSKQYYTAAEVAAMVGFSDPNYFNKCFKKYVGVPPKTYAVSNLSHREP